MSVVPDRGICFIQVLSCVLGRLVMTNDANPDSNTVLTKFHALRAPNISIKDYLERIYKYSACSPECFILALVYIDRLIARNGIALNSLNVHRIIITMVMLAAKFFDDLYFNNKFFARVGGVPRAELDALELEALFAINFSLHVPTEVFEKYHSELASHAGIDMDGDPNRPPIKNDCDCDKYVHHLVYDYADVCYTGLKLPVKLIRMPPQLPPAGDLLLDSNEMSQENENQ